MSTGFKQKYGKWKDNYRQLFKVYFSQVDNFGMFRFQHLPKECSEPSMVMVDLNIH